MARLGERFYRPPGQEQTGSGLGLSIVQRIAGLHGLKISFANRAEGGLIAKVML
ncbi:ATP-binding protein [Burkholderia sp. SIMBA_024]|uniref:ATP-binding protein n=1 Tax=Burkholderia sp. SIMBA_024 TaxID=3085768 RepID=UPI0039793063